LADGSIASRTGQSFDADKFIELNVSYVYPDSITGNAGSSPIGTAEAVVKDGQIIGFKITNTGSGYPLKDSIFIDDQVLEVTSGSIHGYQQARQVEMDNFRQKLNTLVGDIVTNINQVYNPEDEPGKYVFGFPGMISRVTQGVNQLYPDQQGDGTLSVYHDEVDITIPYSDSDTFTIVNASAFFPDDRNTDRELLVEDPNFSKIYVGARRMKNVTIENDMDYVGPDGLANTKDDGRSNILAYEEIPFRMAQGDQTFIFGDNFSFDTIIKEDRNLAKALTLDEGFTFDSLITTHTGEAEANEVALAIAELGNDDFTEQLATMTTEVGTTLGDVVDNLEHQQMVEGLLLDERQSVSSVSIDEEVANLMRYQRAFQASARVVSTLDSMLELIVMGLIR
jgi:flagellar hook-associated protein FlgK